MKMYWSSRSPYVRKAMVFAHEVGVADRIETTRVVVSATIRNDELDATTPLGQIPTLVTDDGALIYDSLVICTYLDGLHDGRRLIPPDGPERLDALRRHALGNGMLDNLLKWLMESRRDPATQSAEIVAAFRRKTHRALDVLESMAPSLGGAPVDIGQIAIGVALAYVDFRFGAEDWRAGRPALAAWHVDVAARPSMIATEFADVT